MSLLTREELRRFPPVDDPEIARIEACNDLATLERWLARSVTAVSASDALG